MYGVGIPTERSYVLSAGFMCAQGWHGKTRFNPAGIKTYIKEYDLAPTNFLEGRGTQSGAHVDIMGNFSLIKDIIKVAASAIGEDMGTTQSSILHQQSSILAWSPNLRHPQSSTLYVDQSNFPSLSHISFI